MSWNSEAARLQGRTADLKDAYKQVGVKPSHRHLSVVVVHDPESDSYQYYAPNTLLFGQTAAVSSFTRVARSLQKLFVRGAGLYCTNFFDDFPMVEPAATAEQAHALFNEVLELLGWRVALEEKKNKPFADSFACLGVEINLAFAFKGKYYRM